MIVATFGPSNYTGFRTAVHEFGARDMVFADHSPQSFQAMASGSGGGINVFLNAAERPATFDEDFPRAVQADTISPS